MFFAFFQKCLFPKIFCVFFQSFRFCFLTYACCHCTYMHKHSRHQSWLLQFCGLLSSALSAGEEAHIPTLTNCLTRQQSCSRRVRLTASKLNWKAFLGPADKQKRPFDEAPTSLWRVALIFSARTTIYAPHLITCLMP